jgi:hypothetical protein
LNKCARCSKSPQSEFGDARIFISAKSLNADAVDQELQEKKSLTNTGNGMCTTDAIDTLVEEHATKNMFEKKILSKDSLSSVNR